MLTKSGRVMKLQEFGDALLRTRDLDPVYVGLAGAKLDPPQLARWLLAYWCFYHVGSASWLSEQTGADFWQGMRVAAENVLSPHRAQHSLPEGRWPRAAERRHFRGAKCAAAVEWLRTQSAGIPEAPVTGLARWVGEAGSSQPSQPPVLTADELMRAVQLWPMFGPWIAFKAADMMERVWGLPVTFDRNLGLMYEEPRRGLDLAVIEEGWTCGAEVGYERLLTYFSPRLAPPGGRNCGPQEVETILCKWKSHVGGHYWVGKDIHEQRAALAGWGATAERVLRAYPSEVPAQAYA